MNSVDIKMQQGHRKFDWDDINVCNNKLEDSQSFFSKKHYEHERLDDMEFLLQEAVKDEIDELKNQKDFLINNKENIAQNKEHEHELKVKLENLTLNASTTDSVNIKHEDNPLSPENLCENTEDGQVPQQKVTPNLACEWSTKKIVKACAVGSKGAVCKSMPPPPQAYLVKDIYQKKREEAERRRAEEERKKREFHARPVPKFEAYHELLQKRKIIHSATVPITPQVLKKSNEAEEKRRKRLEEWKLKNQPPKFEPRPPTVLKEKPFVPEKKSTIVQQCPFKLNMEKRLQERKHYDELKQKALEEKLKQEEEERKKLEKEHIRELRKAATFKARPNPFKN